MKSKFILIGALLLAIVTTVLFSKYVNSIDKKYKNDKTTVQVVVLKQDVIKNQMIAEDMLETKDFNASTVLPQAIKSSTDIVGSYTLVDMKAGEMLIADRFTDQAKEKELITRKISEGKRAVSIDVSYVESVSTLIEPEDNVDVIYTIVNEEDEPVTSTILKNVRVLAVGKRITQKDSGTAENNQDAAQGAQDQASYTAVTLELDPIQVEQIINAEQKGNLKFALRSAFDKK
jgi:pilus assembly protein CpaB